MFGSKSSSSRESSGWCSGNSSASSIGCVGCGSGSSSAAAAAAACGGSCCSSGISRILLTSLMSHLRDSSIHSGVMAPSCGGSR